MTFAISQKRAAQIDELIRHYPPERKRSASLMVLHALQEEHGWLSKEAIEWTAAKLGLEPIHVYELVTFYPMFRQQPVGRHVIRVCRTLSCALGGAAALREHLCAKLGLDPQAHGLQTTADGRFSVEYVECLASCGTAPVMMCDEDFYEGVSPANADKVLAGCA